MGANRKVWDRAKTAVDFRCLVDEAYLLAFEGQYDEAIALLQANQPNLATDDAAYLDIMICHLTVDKTVAQGNYTGAVEEDYARCEKCGGNLKSGSTEDASTTGSETNASTGSASGNDDFTSNQVSLSIVPNPVNGISNIEITLPDYEGVAELIVINSAGQKVLQQTIDGSQTKVQVSNGKFPTGLYLVNLMINGQTVAAEKMMVME